MRLRSALLATILAALPAIAEAGQITGAGSTFAAPLYSKWAEAAAATTGVTLNYQAVGSGAGIKLINQRTVDFGASDKPLGGAELVRGNLLQFPTAMGAVDIIVNLPGIAPDTLKLSGPVLAGIYMGKIKSWNDPAIAALNPGVKLPDLAVAPVYRADGSGTTFVFTSYLSAVDPEFKSQVGAATAVSWPAGTGARGTDGVAASVKNTHGGIGYAESAYAILNHLTTVQLRNRDGRFVTPTAQSFAAAAANADWSKARNFAIDLNDQPGAESWPILSATFVLLPKNPADPHRAAEVVKFFDWAYANGDDIARQLQYIPLPAKVKDDVRTAWKKAGLTQ